MKKINTLMIISSMVLMACGGNEKKESAVETTAEKTGEASVFQVNDESSKVHWRGEVAGVYGHEGFVNFEKGMVEVTGDQISGGEFVVDMTGIYPTDSASFKDEDGRRISDLQNHLSTDDFFATEKYPTAKFVITGVEGNSVKGNLTVRDQTNEEVIELESMSVENGNLTAHGTLVFNRQDYNVAWVHFMKDMVLSDNIQLNFTVVANKG